MNLRLALVIAVTSLALLIAIASAQALASGAGVMPALLLALSAPPAALGLAVLARAAYLDGRRARELRVRAKRVGEPRRKRRRR